MPVIGKCGRTSKWSAMTCSSTVLPNPFRVGLDTGAPCFCQRKVSRLEPFEGSFDQLMSIRLNPRWRNGGSPPHETSTSTGATSSVPGRHVRRVRRSVGTRAEELVVVVGIDVMSLHHPHEMHRIGAAGKAAVSVMDVVADRFRAGEPLRADSDRAGAMLRLRHAMRYRPRLPAT